MDGEGNGSGGRSLVASDVIFRQQPMKTRVKGSVSMLFIISAIYIWNYEND